MGGNNRKTRKGAGRRAAATRDEVLCVVGERGRSLLASPLPASSAAAAAGQQLRRVAVAALLISRSTFLGGKIVVRLLAGPQPRRCLSKQRHLFAEDGRQYDGRRIVNFGGAGSALGFRRFHGEGIAVLFEKAI